MPVTVHGGGTTILTFNTFGSAANNYASDFSGAIGANPPAVSTLSNGETESTTPGALNIVYSGGPTSDYTLSSPDQFTYVSVGNATTVNGSSAGDTVFGGAALTYIEASGGHDNRVVFTEGNNTFIGATNDSGDTVGAGTGYDTIITGGGPTTVFGGAGPGGTTIVLNGVDDVVVQSGNATVFAAASSDGTIFVGGTGTLTFAADSSASVLTTSIYDSVGSTANLFGAAGTNLLLAGGGTANFMAGAGNETLNGFNFSGTLSYTGDTTPGDSVNAVVVGGSGTDYFVTGAGNEYFQAGTGFDSFNISSIPGGANITIADFSASDSVSFQASITSEGTDAYGYSVTLSDGTHVEFLGINHIT